MQWFCPPPVLTLMAFAQYNSTLNLIITLEKTQLYMSNKWEDVKLMAAGFKDSAESELTWPSHLQNGAWQDENEAQYLFL